MSQSDNPIFKAKANSLIQECFYLFKKKNIHCRLCAVHRAKKRKKKDELNWTLSNKWAVSPDKLSSAGARQVLAHNLSPLQFGLRYFPHHKFSEHTEQLERCLGFLKAAEPKPLNYEFAEQQGREAHLFHDLADGQRFFFFFCFFLSCCSRRIALPKRSPERFNRVP